MCVNKFFMMFSLAVLCIAAGCAGEPVLDVVAARGKVSLDGKAIDGVTVSFLPLEGVEGKGGHGVTDSTGQFTAQADQGVEGIVPGKYRVLFQKIRLSDGSPIPPDAMATDVDAKNFLSPVYSDPAASPILVTVSDSGEEALVFDLQSRPAML